MKAINRLFVVVLLGATAGAAAYAGDIKIVANSSVSAAAITADEMKGVFLAVKTSLSDGSRVEPVLEKSGPVHEAFLKQFIGKTETALETYYRSLVFTGKGAMPKSLGSDQEVVAYVRRTKGAIGYVSSESATEGVKILQLK